MDKLLATPLARLLAALAHEPIVAAALSASGFGFVILHRCDNDFYF